MGYIATQFHFVVSVNWRPHATHGIALNLLLVKRCLHERNQEVMLTVLTIESDVNRIASSTPLLVLLRTFFSSKVECLDKS